MQVMQAVHCEVYMYICMTHLSNTTNDKILCFSGYHKNLGPVNLE